MIEKVIKVGKGLGPLIHTQRYTNVLIKVCGLADGEVFVMTPHKDHHILADSDLALGEVGSVQIMAATKSAVVVKLRAEAA